MPPSVFKGEPTQIPFNGGPPTQIWSGTQAAAGTPVLCVNQDTANTVYIGYQTNIAIGGANAVPLAPQSSIPLDGSRSIYAIAQQGTANLLVIPGASSFFQRLSSLTIPIGATSGERIVINGATGTITGFDSFNNVTFIISPTAILMYAP